MFLKSLFAGEIHEKLVFPFPQVKKEEEETLRLVLESLRRFAEENVDSAQIDRDAKIPDKVLQGLKELGVFGLLIPEKYGGLGLSQMAYGRVFEDFGGMNASIAATMGAHASIGMKG